MQGAQGPLSIRGTRQSGADVRQSNVTAVVAVANIVKSSLGPVGLDKMLVDDIGDVCITNDGATILKMLEVEHPAAKILVELAELQDQEVGDGTTSVVIVAAELLKRAHELVKNKIHPTSIIAGYRIAMKESVKFINSNMAISTSTLGPDTLLNCAKTAMSSKIVGAQEEFFGKMVVEAIEAVKTYNDMGDARYPVKAINVLKAHGRSAMDSELIQGYALNMGRAAQGMPTRIVGAKIACLDFNLQKARMHMGVQVQVTDPKALERIRQEEMNIVSRQIQKIIAAGANVILTTRGIDDFCLKEFVEAGCIACRRVPSDDMKRVAKATGARIVLTLADEDASETFEASCLGSCEEVVEERVSDDDMIFLKGCATSRAVTILLRGANDYMLDEMDRALHDALCIVKRVLENSSVVPGGGAVEAGLSIYLENFADTLGSKEQLAINEFAEALLVIPKILATNAAKDATDLVAKLRTYHNHAQKRPDKKHLAQWGLDLMAGTLRNNVEAGVLEPTMNKVKLIQFATEAALTILRIDDMIKVEKDPAEEEQ